MAKQQVKTLEQLMEDKVSGSQPVNEAQAAKNAEVGEAAAPKTGLEAVIEARSGGELPADQQVQEPKKEKDVKQESQPKKEKEVVTDEPKKKLPWNSKYNKEEGEEISQEAVKSTEKPSKPAVKYDDETLTAAEKYRKHKSEIELLQTIQKAGGLNKHISEILGKNPDGKPAEQLLKESVRRSLEGYFGKGSEEITDDVIENEIDSMSLVAKARASKEEREIQLKEYQEGLSTIQSPEQKRAESTAKEADEYLKTLSGKEHHSIIVTPDRYEKLQSEMDAYSKGDKQITGQDLIDFIYFKTFIDEIKDAAYEIDRNTKIESAISKVKGSEKRVSASRTADTGSSQLSTEEQSAQDLKNQFLAPVREVIQKQQERQVSGKLV